MNKSELETVIARKLNRPQYEIHLIVSTMLESITEVLAANEKVNLHNFGKLYPRRRIEHLVRNPRSGVPCMLEPLLSVKFCPSKNLLDRINSK